VIKKKPLKGKKERLELIQKALGEVLRDLRKKADMSQLELGEEADYHFTYISQLERGTKQAGFGTIFLLAEKLNTTPDKIMKAVIKKLDKKKVRTRPTLNP
jgi:transcriptional regulator with XRE-family HTH domain